MAVGIRHADHVVSSIRKKLAITSRTSGGRSVGIVRSRTQTMEFFFFFINLRSIRAELSKDHEVNWVSKLQSCRMWPYAGRYHRIWWYYCSYLQVDYPSVCKVRAASTRHHVSEEHSANSPTPSEHHTSPSNQSSMCTCTHSITRASNSDLE
jgi:hypothetical protein